MNQIPQNPLQNIALCMSGGGYRAASFHLGAMSYLNKTQFQNKSLLENVKAISTVSGGTITGVVYALFKEHGKSFEEVYRFLIQQLKDRDLIKEGLGKLKLDGKWNNDFKRRNLINSLSELYDEYFTDQVSFDLFLKEQLNSHLELVVFNATEFENGINFRFQNQGFLGNNNIRIAKEVKGEIKLADVIAASSCFPGGFEPIGFPSDFQHDNSANLCALKSTSMPLDIGLMDGGIYDNQGIEAIKLAEARNKELYDLIIISDVSSPDMQGFRFHEESEKTGLRNINLKQFWSAGKQWHIYALMLFGVLMIGGVAIAAIAGFTDNIGTGVGMTILSFGIVLTALYLALRNRLGRIMKRFVTYVQGLIPAFYYQQLSALDLADYRVGDYEPLIIDRIKSLLLLVQDVFLKHIRRLNYSKVYDNEEYHFRRIANLSKELTKKQFEIRTKKFQSNSACPEILKKSYDELLGEKLSEIITEASNFGTNLWFTKDDALNRMLNKLIIAGQATMCFNMMVYVIELKSSEDFIALKDEVQGELNNVLDQCLEDWWKFVSNPDWML